MTCNPPEILIGEKGQTNNTQPPTPSQKAVVRPGFSYTGSAEHFSTQAHTRAQTQPAAKRTAVLHGLSLMQ